MDCTAQTNKEVNTLSRKKSSLLLKWEERISNVVTDFPARSAQNCTDVPSLEFLQSQTRELAAECADGGPGGNPKLDMTIRWSTYSSAHSQHM